MSWGATDRNRKCVRLIAAVIHQHNNRYLLGLLVSRHKHKPPLCWCRAKQTTRHKQYPLVLSLLQGGLTETLAFFYEVTILLQEQIGIYPWPSAGGVIAFCEKREKNILLGYSLRSKTHPLLQVRHERDRLIGICHSCMGYEGVAGIGPKSYYCHFLSDKNILLQNQVFILGFIQKCLILIILVRVNWKFLYFSISCWYNFDFNLCVYWMRLTPSTYGCVYSLNTHVTIYKRRVSSVCLL